MYDGSVAEENTLQLFKEQQVSKRDRTQWHHRDEDYRILTFESTLVLLCGTYKL